MVKLQTMMNNDIFCNGKFLLKHQFIPITLYLNQFFFLGLCHKVCKKWGKFFVILKLSNSVQYQTISAYYIPYCIMYNVYWGFFCNVKVEKKMKIGSLQK